MNFFRTMLLLAAMTALFMGVGYLIGGTGGMMIAFLFAVGTNAFAYWNSDKMVLRMHNAEPVTRASAPELYDMVGRLAQRAELPMPKVYLIREDQPNAFATGRNPENAAVAATTGILQLLDREELEGVIAHELAHIKNRDTLTMTVAATVAGAISMLAQFGFFFGGGRDRDNPMGPIGVLLAVLFAPLAAVLIQMTISRTREYSADKLGARDQRQPAGPRRRAAQDLGLCRADRDAERRAQPDLGAAVHRQPAVAGSGWTTCSRRIRTSRTASGRSRRWPARRGPRVGDPAEPDPHRAPALSAPGLAARRAAAALVAGVLEQGASLDDQEPDAGAAGAGRAGAGAGARGGNAAAPRPDRRAARAAFSRKPPPARGDAGAAAGDGGDASRRGAGARGGGRRGAAGAGGRRAARGSPGSSTPWRGGWPTAGRRSGTRRPRRGCRGWLAGPVEAAWGPAARRRSRRRTGCGRRST